MARMVAGRCFARLWRLRGASQTNRRGLAEMSDSGEQKKQIAKIVDSITVKAIARLSIAAVIPLSAWGISILKNTYDEVITLRTEMSQQTKDPYTGSDARKDLTGMLTLISRNQSDIAVVAARQLKDEEFMYRHTNQH